jgi:prepilin-type N-terminal cleavage/methylation domain-containing protein
MKMKDLKITLPGIRQNAAGFTLIELLVVIAIMAIIAGLLLAVTAGVKKLQDVKMAQSELEQIKSALDNYKTQYGFYPPANPLNPAVNQLYYELSGVSANGGNYQTLDGASTIAVTAYVSTFNVNGAVNLVKSGGDVETVQARNFLPGLKANRIGSYATGINLLTTSVPIRDPSYVPVGVANLNPFNYTYPGTNNPGSYDLWIDLKISGKTNRICNWHNAPIIL